MTPAGHAARQDPALPALARAHPRRMDTRRRGRPCPACTRCSSCENTAGWHTYWYMIAQPAFPRRTSPTRVRRVRGGRRGDHRQSPRRPWASSRSSTTCCPAALTPAREAMKPDAPARCRCWTSSGPREGNIQQPVYVRQRGDVEGGLAEAEPGQRELLQRCRPSTHGRHPDPLLHRGSGTARAAHRLRGVAGACGTSSASSRSLSGSREDRVRVVVQSMGGGFGSKAGRAAGRFTMPRGWRCWPARPVRPRADASGGVHEPPAALRGRGHDAPRREARRHADRAGRRESCSTSARAASTRAATR